MKIILILLSLSLFSGKNIKEIYSFSGKSSNETTSQDIKQVKTKPWRVVNDGVMGGISTSSITINELGYGKFSGNISLENNGGFASIQLDTLISLDKNQKFIVLRLKGDGKSYEFRLKGKISQSESYVHKFETSGDWETIYLEINKFYPQFRGRKLNIPNFDFRQIEQMGFLIANKRKETFELLVDWISIQ